MKRFIFICLLLCVRSAFAQSQSEDIRKPDMTVADEGAKPIYALAYDSNGRCLAVAGSGGSIRLYGKLLDVASLPRTAGKPLPIVAIGFKDTNTLVSVSSDQTVTTWDLVSGKALHNTALHFGNQLPPVLSPDGQPFLAGATLKRVALWNYESDEPLKTFEANDSNVGTLAFTPDGKLLVIGTIKGVVRVLDVATWKVTRSVDLDSPIHALAASAGHIVVGYSDGTVAMVNFGDRSSIQELEAHKQAVSAVAFSPSGDRFASGSVDGSIKVWNTETLKPICALGGHAAKVLAIVFSPDGRNVAASGTDGRVNEWRLPLQ